MLWQLRLQLAAGVSCYRSSCLTRLVAMAFRAFLVFLSFVGAFGEDVAEALASDDVCASGQDCSLELSQLRGMKVHYLDALMDDTEENEEEAVQVEEDAEMEGGACTNSHDMGVWKHGGRRSFDAALNSCGRGCAAGFPCTKDSWRSLGKFSGPRGRMRTGYGF